MAGVFLVITFFICSIFPILILIDMLSFFLWLILMLISFVYIFQIWRKYKFLSFIPPAILLICFFIAFYAGRVGYAIGAYKKPCSPDSFFNEKNRQELTIIAEELLQSPAEEDIKTTKKKLKEYGLVVMTVNTCEDVVEFGYARTRTWFLYIYSKKELPEIYNGEPVITECDILQWGELVSIIKTENDQSKYKREGISFEPEIVYPFLAEHLDKKFIDKLASLPAQESLDSYMRRHFNPLRFAETLDKWHKEYDKLVTSKLNKEERLKVIEVLNKHCHTSNKLIENDNIRLLKEQRPYVGRGTLEFCNYIQLRSRFLDQLISDGVVRIKDEEGHLEVKLNLTDEEKRSITWLQIELMDFCYGNLIAKTQYSSTGKTKLADNWYFYTD